jgi:hypothetical protein
LLWLKKQKPHLQESPGVRLRGSFVKSIISWRYNMKKLVIGIAVLLLLAGSASTTFGVSGVEGKVTAYGLNVRTGPGVA